MEDYHTSPEYTEIQNFITRVNSKVKDSSTSSNRLKVKLKNSLTSLLQSMACSPTEARPEIFKKIKKFYEKELENIRMQVYKDKKYLAPNVKIEKKEAKPRLYRLNSNAASFKHRSDNVDFNVVRRKLRHIETKRLVEPEKKFVENKKHRRVASFGAAMKVNYKISNLISNKDILKAKHEQIKAKRSQEEVNQYVDAYGRQKSVFVELRQAKREIQQSIRQKKRRTQSLVPSTMYNSKSNIFDKLVKNEELTKENFYLGRTQRKTFAERFKIAMFDSNPERKAQEEQEEDNNLLFYTNKAWQTNNWLNSSMMDMKKGAERTFRSTFRKSADSAASTMFDKFYEDSTPRFDKYYLPKKENTLLERS